MSRARRSPASLVALLVQGWAWAGCGGPQLRSLSPALRAELDRAREESARVRRLRASGRVEADRRLFGREVSARFLLLVDRPDRYRMRILEPAGTVLFDLLWDSGRATASRIGPDGVSHAIPPSEQTYVPAAELARVLLHRFEGDAFEDDGHGCLAFVMPGGRRVESVACIGPGLPRNENDVVWREGRPFLQIALDFFGDEDGLPVKLPHGISVGPVGGPSLLRIRIERYTIDPAIPPEAFQP